MNKQTYLTTGIWLQSTLSNAPLSFRQPPRSQWLAWLEFKEELGPLSITQILIKKLRKKAILQNEAHYATVIAKRNNLTLRKKIFSLLLLCWLLLFALIDTVCNYNLINTIVF